MRKLFRSYYKLTKEEFAKMWQECIFAFDANVLLNIYRYTPETRKRLFEILKRLQDRIWLPYQVAYEYHERRLDVISAQLNAYDAMETRLNKSLQEIDNELRKYKRHAFADIGQITEIIKNAVESAKALLLEARSKHPDLLLEDNLLETITDLFDEKIGEPFSQEHLEQVHQDAEQRFQQKTPPGYKDTNKDGSKQYGDVVMWFQLIDYAKSQKKPLIFVTDDDKEDWWLRHNGKTIGPRRELIQEMFDKAGVTFYMYSTDQFMAQAENFLDLQDHQGTQAAIEEVKEIRLEAQSLALQAQADAVAQETQYAQDKPVLIPLSALPLSVGELDYTNSELPLDLMNVGTGVALNISGVLVPPKDIPRKPYSFSNQAHLLQGKEVKVFFHIGQFLFFTEQDKFGEYHLWPSSELTQAGTAKRRRYAARLTLTYIDMYGNQHATIYDYTDVNEWKLVALFRVQHDLDDMDKEKKH